MSDRSSVAKEAARLLYSSTVEEYIQAKEMAVVNLSAKGIPSNYEVAVELDRLADELEGGERQQRLADMRRTALEVMKRLKAFSPRLIGSVWRGTARIGSDIDIVALSSRPSDVEAALKSYTIRDRGKVTFKGGVHAYHLKLDLDGNEVEVVVRDTMKYIEERCDIYGDVRRGITLSELERLLRVNPLRKFVPRRRSR